MRPVATIACIALLVAVAGQAQQSNPAPVSSTPGKQAEHVKVFAVGADVTAPELLPTGRQSFQKEKCKNKLDGNVELTFLVDTTGTPHNITVIQPPGPDLSELAASIIAEDRFKPAMREGAPVNVMERADLRLQDCEEEIKDAPGQSQYIQELRSAPQQRFSDLLNPPDEAVFSLGADSPNTSSAVNDQLAHIGGSVTAPIIIHSVYPRYTNEAKRAKMQGVCILTLIVDAEGNPQHIWVTRPLDYGLDENAKEAVQQYRFKPATKNGVPVAVVVSIEISFHLY